MSTSTSSSPRVTHTYPLPSFVRTSVMIRPSSFSRRSRTGSSTSPSDCLTDSYPGYFKRTVLIPTPTKITDPLKKDVDRDHHGHDDDDDDHRNHHHHHNNNNSSSSSNHNETKNAVLVVAFGSAPGEPNWGGVLRRVKEALVTAVPGTYIPIYTHIYPYIYSHPDLDPHPHPDLHPDSHPDLTPAPRSTPTPSNPDLTPRSYTHTHIFVR